MKVVAIFDLDEDWYKIANERKERGDDDWDANEWINYAIGMGPMEVGLEDKLIFEGTYVVENTEEFCKGLKK